jgi:hypothetical protein
LAEKWVDEMAALRVEHWDCSSAAWMVALRAEWMVVNLVVRSAVQLADQKAALSVVH